MTTISQIGWGSYGGYEGPRYIGNKKFVMPPNPRFEDKLMLVISSSEGNAGSINMYDRAILSVGFIQWIELGQYSVSDMIGYMAERYGYEFVESKLKPALMMSKSTFKKTIRGKWRFHVMDPNGKEVVVETEPLSRWLFCRSSGKVGTWTEVNKLWAKTWAAVLVDLFEDDKAVAAQIEWTVPQLKARFLGQNGRSIIFADGTPYDGYGGALKALLVAYGVNLPVIAEKVITAAISRSRFPRWSKQWCLDLMHDLALTSGVSIWPGRYDFKRPSLELAFGIQLPKNHNELSLRSWTNEVPQVIVPVAEPTVNRPYEETEFNVKEDVFVRPERPVSSESKGWLGGILDFSSKFLGKVRKKP